MGTAQTSVVSSRRALRQRGRGNGLEEPLIFQGVTNPSVSRILLERVAIEGDSPVGENRWTPDRLPSTAGHVEPCGNSGGPSPKAKYSLVTDSEPVP